MPAFVYIIRSADGSYYVGSARGESLDRRMSEHREGAYPGYTSRLRPVTLVWAEQCNRITDAIAYERRLKGWSRAKKEALIRGDRGALRDAAKQPTSHEKSNPFPSS